MRAHWMIAVILSSTGGAPALAQATGEPPEAGMEAGIDEVRHILEGLKAEGATPESIAEDIAGLGPEIVPGLLRLLDGGFPAADGPPAELGMLERRTVLQGLALLGRDRVMPWIEAGPTDRSLELSPSTLLTVIGAIGRAQDVHVALQLATPARSSDRVPWSSADGLRETCERILQRDPQGCQAIRSLLPNARRELQEAMIASMSSTGDPVALTSLAQLLGIVPELDRNLLATMTAVASRFEQPVSPDVCDEVRRYLWETDRRLRREGILATAAIRDNEAIGRLIQLLRSDEGDLKRLAQGALRDITGLGFGEDPERWTSWFLAENAWYRDEAPAVLDSLEAEDAGSVLMGLTQIVRHPLFRRDLAPRVEQVLDRDEPALRRKTCMVLAQLGSQEQAPRLVELLDDREEAVAAAAHAALLAITGIDLPPVREAWDEAVRAEEPAPSVVR